MASNHNDLKSKTVASFLWNLVEKASSQIISLVVQIVLARILSPSDFGVLAIMLVFINIGNVFVQSGLDTAIIQSEKLDDIDVDSAFWMSFSLALLLYSLLFISAPMISEYYQMDTLSLYLRVLGLVLPFNSLYSIQVAQVTRRLDFKRIFIATFLATSASGCFGIIIVSCGGGIWGLVVQQLSFSIIACMTLTFETRWVPHFRFSCARAKILFDFSSKLLASGLLGTIYQSLSDLIIGKQFKAESLGYFNQGKKYPQTLGSTLNATIQPIMLSLVAKVQTNTQQVKSTVRLALKSSTFIVVPAMFYCAAAADPIVELVLGQQWLPSVPFFRAFCFYFALLPIHNANLQALNGIGRSDIYLRIEIIQDICGIAILLISTYVFNSIIAIAMGYCVAGILSVFITAMPNRDTINYTYLEQIVDILPTFIIAALSAIAAYACIRLMKFGLLALIAISVIVMGAIYLALAFAFRLDALFFVVSILRDRNH